MAHQRKACVDLAILHVLLDLTTEPVLVRVALIQQKLGWALMHELVVLGSRCHVLQIGWFDLIGALLAHGRVFVQGVLGLDGRVAGHAWGLLFQLEVGLNLRLGGVEEHWLDRQVQEAASSQRKLLLLQLRVFVLE